MLVTHKKFKHSGGSLTAQYEMFVVVAIASAVIVIVVVVHLTTLVPTFFVMGIMVSVRLVSGGVGVGNNCV